MADYIRRDFVLQVINTVNRLDGFAGYADYCSLFDEIESAPASDVQLIKHGHWIEDGNCFHYCSECLENTIRDIDSYGCECGEFLTDFCPNCGADMREEG